MAAASVPAVQACDTLIKGLVITMDPQRRVFMDGYVAVSGSKIVGVGKASECPFAAQHEAAGTGLRFIPRRGWRSRRTRILVRK